MDTDQQGRVIRESIPLEGLRAMICNRMLTSSRDFPQGTAMAQIELTALVAFREELKAQGIKVSFGDLFVKATACAIENNMSLNASRVDDTIFYYDSINIGMMASINNILMEPVVFDVPNKSVIEIGEELAKAYENLKNNKLMRVKLEGSTFSISNLGMFPLDGFTPLLSPPLGGILGIGAIKKQPVVLPDDTIAARPVVTISLTSDHGLVDGIVVAQFIKDFVAIVAEPEKYMMRKHAST